MKEKKGEKKRERNGKCRVGTIVQVFRLCFNMLATMFLAFSCSFVRKRRQLFRLNQRFLFSQKKRTRQIENCAGVILLLHNFFLVRLRQSWSRQKPIDCIEFIHRTKLERLSGKNVSRGLWRRCVYRDYFDNVFACKREERRSDKISFVRSSRYCIGSTLEYLYKTSGERRTFCMPLKLYVNRVKERRNTTR